MSEEPQTELQFLIDLLLNHRLTPSTKKLVADRIGKVETELRCVPRGTYQPPMTRPAPVMAQSPSTLALMAKHGDLASAQTPPTHIDPMPAQPAIPASQRIIGGEVKTGNGIKGPRKF